MATASPTGPLLAPGSWEAIPDEEVLGTICEPRAAITPASHGSLHRWGDVLARDGGLMCVGDTPTVSVLKAAVFLS